MLQTQINKGILNMDTKLNDEEFSLKDLVYKDH
jgi:hypothetical protein